MEKDIPEEEKSQILFTSLTTLSLARDRNVTSSLHHLHKLQQTTAVFRLQRGNTNQAIGY